MERCLPGLSPTLREHTPRVMALCDRLGAHEGLSDLVTAQVEMFGERYCGGMIERSLREMLRGS